MIPSHSRNAMSGWSNYSGMVTSHRINESWMGNRVSKSNEIFCTLCGFLPLLYSFVKEQRVYGSYCFAMIVIIVQNEQLRCTLTVYESRYQVEVLSNLDVVLASLSPFFVTGFIDAEGSFRIKTTGRYMQPDFSIGLHVKDKELLLKIKV